jgi:MerR family Zn(II)-responsive transcriptional regulator of zntA
MQMSEKNLKIGELAKLLKVSQDTLRFYEKHGLLAPSLRSQAGCRLYSRADVERVGFILSAKRVGFTLNEIHDLLGLEVTKDDKSCEDVKRFVDEKLDNLNQRIGEMQRIKKTLKTLSDACCGGAEPATHCTILEALNAQAESGPIPRRLL